MKYDSTVDTLKHIVMQNKTPEQLAEEKYPPAQDGYHIPLRAAFISGWKAKKVLQWVKASERLPEQTLYDFHIKVEGTPSIGSYRKGSDIWVDDAGDFFPSDQIEWLDENLKTTPNE